MVLTREDAVSGWRAMMGPTDPRQALELDPDSYVFADQINDASDNKINFQSLNSCIIVEQESY